MSSLALALTFGLVGVALALSYTNRIGLEKDILVGSARAVVQLCCVGLVLRFVFAVDNVAFTSIMLLVMVANASVVAAKRGERVRHAGRIAFGAISAGLAVTLACLVGVGAVSFTPAEIIPVGGMVVGNAMVALGLLYRGLVSAFNDRRQEVEVKLCLGATPREAARGLVRTSIRTAMAPTVDSMKTLGVVQLPGMMTGLILAGVSPEVAIKYQIMVAFMLTGAVSVSAFVASYWAYRSFFNARAQLAP